MSNIFHMRGGPETAGVHIEHGLSEETGPAAPGEGQTAIVGRLRLSDGSPDRVLVKVDPFGDTKGVSIGAMRDLGSAGPLATWASATLDMEKTASADAARVGVTARAGVEASLGQVHAGAYLGVAAGLKGVGENTTRELGTYARAEAGLYAGFHF